MHSPSNPQLAPSTRWFFGVVALIVLTGAALLFQPELMRPLWPWPITPFNAAFLGGVYVTELAMVVSLLCVNRWSPGRIVIPLAVVFTSVVTVVSLLHPDILDIRRLRVQAWFVVYVGSMIVTISYVIRFRHMGSANPRAPSVAWRRLLQVETLCLAVYGAGLFAAPEVFAGIWPWKVDRFHAQVYSAVFLSGGLGAWLLSRAAAQAEWITLGLTQLVLGAVSVLGVLWIDSSLNRVEWRSGASALWLAIFVVIAALGVGMIVQGLRLSTRSRSEIRL